MSRFETDPDAVNPTEKISIMQELECIETFFVQTCRRLLLVDTTTVGADGKEQTTEVGVSTRSQRLRARLNPSGSTGQQFVSDFSETDESSTATVRVGKTPSSAAPAANSHGRGRTGKPQPSDDDADDEDEDAIIDNDANDADFAGECAFFFLQFIFNVYCRFFLSKGIPSATKVRTKEPRAPSLAKQKKDERHKERNEYQTRISAILKNGTAVPSVFSKDVIGKI